MMKITRNKLVSVIKEEIEAHKQELSEMYNRNAAPSSDPREISNLVADAIQKIMQEMPPAEARAKILSMSVSELLDMVGAPDTAAGEAATALGRQQRAVAYFEESKKLSEIIKEELSKLLKETPTQDQ